MPDVIANEVLTEFNKNRLLRNEKNVTYKDFSMQ